MTASPREPSEAGEAAAGAAAPGEAAPLSSAEVLQPAFAEDVARLVEHEPDVRKGVDPEAVHQARVATRRLRSQLRTFRRALRPKVSKRLSGSLKELAGLLGEVRDLDVLAERFESAREASGEPVSVPDRVVDDVLLKLSREREAVFGELVAEMDSEGYRRLVAELEAFAAEPPFRKVAHRPAIDVLEPAVREAWDGLERTVAELRVVPSDAELHQARIRAKRARYAAQAATPFSPPACKKLAKRLGKLQDALGLLNDGVHAVDWLQRVAAMPPEPPGSWLELRAGAELSGDSYLAGIELLVARQHLVMAAARQEWPGRWSRARVAAGELGWLGPS